MALRAMRSAKISHNLTPHISSRMAYSHNAASRRASFSLCAPIRPLSCSPLLQARSPCLSKIDLSLPHVSIRGYSLLSWFRKSSNTIESNSSHTTGTELEALNSLSHDSQTSGTSDSIAKIYEILDEPSHNDISVPISNPEIIDIGYLKSLGVEFSWVNPASFIEWLLEHIHVYMGTPWWASIVIGALVIRLLLFKFILQSSDMMARMQTIIPYTRPIHAKLQAAIRDKDLIKMSELQNELSELNKRMGIRPSKSIIPAVFQGFMGYGVFKFMWAVSDLPVPSLQQSGFGWITDLTVADPYYILPVTMAVTIFIASKASRSSTSISGPMTPQMSNIILALFPVIAGAVMINMPACLQLSFVATSVITAITNVLLLQPSVRRLFNLTPLPGKLPLSLREGPKPLEDRITIATWEKSPDSSEVMKVVSRRYSELVKPAHAPPTDLLGRTKFFVRDFFGLEHSSKGTSNSKPSTDPANAYKKIRDEFRKHGQAREREWRSQQKTSNAKA